MRVYDYRTDIRNVDITPEIRSRFLRFAPHETHTRHSHDLGHEVFLVLEGRGEFEIDGETAILGPGQYCFVPANKLHRVHNIADEPMTIYLSVTPHIEPTHTSWDADGRRLPKRYGGATAKERAESPTLPQPIAALVTRQATAMRTLAEHVNAIATEHATLLEQLLESARRNDAAATKEHVDALADHIRQIYQDVSALGSVWNDLAVATTET
jgi:quercetin dioxygenase-like cupin family protein